MRKVAIIQARLGSTRLKNKVLMPLAGKPMLERILRRVRRAKLVDEVVLSIPNDEWGELSAWCCHHYGFVCVWHDDENDLIGRYYAAAKYFNADIVIRICGDNPLVEPGEIDRAIEFYLSYPTTFISNMHQHHIDCLRNGVLGRNNYPDGIGCEVFSYSTLQWMNEHIKDLAEREHPHLRFHRMGIVESPACPPEFARPDLKLDVNTIDEYNYIKDIFDNLYPLNPDFHITDVIKYLDGKGVSDGL